MTSCALFTDKMEDLIDSNVHQNKLIILPPEAIFAIQNPGKSKNHHPIEQSDQCIIKSTPATRKNECSVLGCTAYKNDFEIYKSFPFPTDPTLRRQWAIFCGLDPDKSNYSYGGRVCYVHFPDNIRHTSFCRTLNKELKKHKCFCNMVQIGPNCVPSLYPPLSKDQPLKKMGEWVIHAEPCMEEKEDEQEERVSTSIEEHCKETEQQINLPPKGTLGIQNPGINTDIHPIEQPLPDHDKHTPGTKRKRCSVIGCKAHTNFDIVYKTYPFPTDPVLHKKWAIFCGHNPDKPLPIVNRGPRICSSHFPENIRHTFQCRTYEEYKKQTCRCNVIKIDPNCVPSLCLPPLNDQLLRKIEAVIKEETCVEEETFLQEEEEKPEERVPSPPSPRYEYFDETEEEIFSNDWDDWDEDDKRDSDYAPSSYGMEEDQLDTEDDLEELEPGQLKCLHCSEIFREKHQLELHMLHCHILRCHLCSFYSIGSDGLNIHFQTKHAKYTRRNNKSKLISLDTNGIDKLEKQIVASIRKRLKKNENMMKNETKPIKKKINYHKLNKIKNLKIKNKNVNIDYDLFCKLCDKNFVHKIELQQHYRLTHSMYLCDKNKCHQTFTSLQQMQEHFKCHSKGSAKLCEICAKSFLNLKCLQLHISKEHTQNNPQPKCEKFKCQICFQIYKNKCEFEEHFEMFHGISLQEYLRDVVGEGE